LDGNSLGTEDTTSPYSISWDTKTASIGSHLLSAVARDGAGNITTSAGINVTVSTDTLPPVISGVSVTSVTKTSATSRWNTNEPANGQVEYGTSPCPCSNQTALISNLTTSHAISLSGLARNTLYFYRVKSRDAAGNLSTSTAQNFTTK
jgi:phosphodiesterase/alkaline phosphatase D-like protein